MSYTLEQKFFIITTFIETKSQTVTVRKFKTRFQRETSRNYVKYLFEKLKAHGTVNNARRSFRGDNSECSQSWCLSIFE